MGVILVVGLAVNQVILVVDGLLERRRAGAISRADIVAVAEDRVGMVILVTLAALASLLPLAIGARADELFRAIALATVGGTIAGAVAAIIVVPALAAVGRAGRVSATSNGVMLS